MGVLAEDCLHTAAKIGGSRGCCSCRRRAGRSVRTRGKPSSKYAYYYLFSGSITPPINSTLTGVVGCFINGLLCRSDTPSRMTRKRPPKPVLSTQPTDICCNLPKQTRSCPHSAVSSSMKHMNALSILTFFWAFWPRDEMVLNW